VQRRERSAMFANMSIKQKMTAIFGLIVLIFVSFAGFSAYTAKTINDRSYIIANEWLPGTEALGRIKSILAEYRIKQARHLIASDPAAMAKAENDMVGIKKLLEQAEKDYDSTISTQEDRDLFKEYR